MAGRIRSIKPEILEDERSGSLSSDAWRLWVSMWLLADDHGRLRGAPEWLKAQVFWSPVHVRIKVPDLLDELASAGVILRYVVDGQRYVEIRTWAKHQKIDHPAKPRIPLPPSDLRDVSECLARQSEYLAPDLDLDLDQDLDQEGSLDLERAYAIFPRKEGKAGGMKRAREAIKTKTDFDRLMRAIENYKRSQVVLDGFVMLWSTFMNGRWEDYVDGPIMGLPRKQSASAPVKHRLVSELKFGDDLGGSLMDDPVPEASKK